MNQEQLQLQAAQELEFRRKARKSIYQYMKYMESTGLLYFKFNPAKHHKVIINDLHAMIKGKWDKEAFSLPPGSAKSTYISVILPTFLWLIEPTWKILCISNSEGLVEDFARDRRRIMRSKEWQTLAQTGLQPDAQSLASMANQKGGTLYSAGAGSTITGLRADWIIMDDLVKGFEQAASLGQLDKIWNWLLADARSRLKPDGRELLVATRWSAHDPIGRVLELTKLGQEDWKYARIPMLCDSEDDPVGRSIGDPLWPQWFNDKMRKDAQRDPSIWNCLYQQNPMTDSGEWLPNEHIHIVPTKPKILKYYIGVDIALTISDKSDWTVFAVFGLDINKNLVLVEIKRYQAKVDQTARDLVQLCQEYTAFAVYVDSDNASVVWSNLVWEESRQQGIPVPLQIIPMKGRDKEVRAAPLRSYFLQNRIQILQAIWNRDLLDELNKFPAVRHDDQVDAMGLVASQLIKMSAPRESEKSSVQKESVIGGSDGRLYLNESMNDLFESNSSSNSKRFSKLRI